MEIKTEIINYIGNFIDKYRIYENINIKFALGKYSEQFGFEDHLFQKDNYTKIKSLLESCLTWENTTITKNTTITTNTNTTEHKSNLQSKLFQSSKEIDKIIILCKSGSYDIMVSINEIVNKEINNENEYVISFKKKNHIFNLCIIKTDINEIYYKFNISSIIPPNYSSVYIGHSSLLKICDTLSKLDNNTHFIFDIITFYF